MAADFLVMIGIWVRSIAMMEIKKTSKDNEFNIFIFWVLISMLIFLQLF